VQLDVLFGWLGGAIFVARLVPQPWRIWRTGASDGVSWLAVANGIVSTSGWLAYGVAVGRPVLWVPSLVALVPEVVTLVLLGARPPDARRALLFGGWLATVALAWPIGGDALLGAVIGLGVLMGVMPAVVAAVTGDRLDGIARRTWQIALLDAALWGAYGLGTSEPLTTFYGIVLGAGSLVILWRLRVTRLAAARRASEVPTVGAVGTDPHDVAVVRFADGS
jgi:uncharacterized protein with PQ loop repeat